MQYVKTIGNNPVENIILNNNFGSVVDLAVVIRNNSDIANDTITVLLYNEYQSFGQKRFEE